MNKFRKVYTFDDVCLVPQFNNIASRTIPNLESWITKNTKVGQPLIPANMDTVISDELADKMIENNSFPIFHRFTSHENQLKWVKKYNNKCYISCGVNCKMDNLKDLFDNGARGVCIDIAHGHSITTIDLIKQLKTNFPEKEVIAGNVCSVMGYSDLVNAGADCVKVGIGPGSACTTRKVTGFGVSQFSAIYDIASVAKKLKVPIIADGGIKSSRDVVLALAAGASTCMIGGLFSKTYESAGNKYLKEYLKEGFVNYKEINKEDIYKYINKGEDIYTHYRGQASENFQKDYYGSMKEGTVAEGINFYSKCNYSTDELLNNILGGLRSGLTYGGAKNIKELQRKAEFVEITNSYMGDLNSK